MATRFTPILIFALGLVMVINGSSHRNNSMLSVGVVIMVLGIIWTGARWQTKRKGKY